MKRILMVMSVAALMVAMVVATAMPAFAQGRGEGAQGKAVGPPGEENPGQLGQPQDRKVGAQERTPLPFGGTEPEKGFNAVPGLVCTAPGSPFFAGAEACQEG